MTLRPYLVLCSYLLVGSLLLGTSQEISRGLSRISVSLETLTKQPLDFSNSIYETPQQETIK